MAVHAASVPPTTTKPKDDSTPRRPEVLDLLFDEMGGAYAYSVLLRDGLGRQLNAQGSHPMMVPHGMSDRDLAEEHATALACSSLPQGTKWGVQQRYARKAILWSRLIGICHQLPSQFINQLPERGYMVDGYIAPEEHLLWSRISGAVLRWVMKGKADQVRKLAFALELLRDPGTEIILGTSAAGEPYVRMASGHGAIAQ